MMWTSGFKYAISITWHVHILGLLSVRSPSVVVVSSCVQYKYKEQPPGATVDGSEDKTATRDNLFNFESPFLYRETDKGRTTSHLSVVLNKDCFVVVVYGYC